MIRAPKAKLLREALQPRGQVHLVADHRVVVARGGSDIAGDDVSCAYANARAKRREARSLLCRFKFSSALENLQRGVNGSIRVVGDLDRRPENRHHRIADVFVDDSARRFDRTGHFGKIGIELFDQLLRRLRLTVRSEIRASRRTGW